MKLLHRLHPHNKSINTDDAKAGIGLQVPTISEDPNEAANELNEDLIESLLVSLHCVTHASEIMQRNFDSRTYRFNHAIIFATPLSNEHPKASNHLFKLASDSFIDTIELPVYEQLFDRKFNMYPLAIKTTRFRDAARLSGTVYDFTVAHLNPYVFDNMVVVNRISYLPTLLKNINSIPILTGNEIPEFEQLQKLNLELQLDSQLIDESLGKPKEVIWDKHWALKNIITSMIK